VALGPLAVISTDVFIDTAIQINVVEPFFLSYALDIGIVNSKPRWQYFDFRLDFSL
jgi:hypothetical protein